MKKILMKTETLEAIASKLNAVSSGLEKASSTLKQIDISRAAGGSLFTRLSSFRFSLLDMTLADEAIEVLLKLIALSANRAANEATQLGERLRNVSCELETGEYEIQAMIDGLCANPEELAQRQAALAKERDRMLNSILRDLDSVVPPSGHFSITSAEKLRNDGFYQFGEGLYSFLTGDWRNMAQSDDTRNHYLFNTLLSSCVDTELKLYSVEDILRYGNDILDMIGDSALKKILTKIGVKKFSGDTFDLIADLSEDALNNLVNHINQMLVLGSLNNSAALNMAAAYQNSSDKNMQSIGHLVTLLVNSSAEELAAFITADTTSELFKDAATTGLYTLAMTGIEAVAASTSITSAALDLTMNTGNNAELTNNLIYASDAVHAMYDGFQQDYAAYKNNPTDANLKKAMESYQAYNRALSISYDAFSAYTANTTDSIVGQLFSSDAAKQADETAAATAQHYRDTAKRMADYQSMYMPA